MRDRPKPPTPAGLLARRRAADAVEAVTAKRRALDDVLDLFADLEPQDQGFARMLAATTIRRLGQIDGVLAERLAKPLPDGLPRLVTVLRLGLAQILFLDVPDHAAVDTAVRLTEADRRMVGFKPLVNAVLRGVAREREAVLARLEPLDILTPWLRERWTRTYGEEVALAIAASLVVEPPLDLTVKSDAKGWADKLGGEVLPTGSVRLVPEGAIPHLPGFAEGAWWVQDAAAAIPARLLGDVAGLSVADLCAAPGGKTAQLAAAGAHVTAVDRSDKRLARLSENLARLKLKATVVVADATTFEGSFDAVLLDAPCSATGTARGHPDVILTKNAEDLASLTRLQARLLDRLPALLKPGGRAVYCTCSLEPEEGEAQIAAFLARTPDMALDPVSEDEFAGLAGFVTTEGFLRTLPSAWVRETPRMSGLDGFFAARLVRR